VLNANVPAKAADYSTKPSFRLDTFERKDTVVPEEKTPKGALSGSRSYGVDKRLVIASRSVTPDFRILLYPMRQGDPVPETVWNDNGDTVTLKTGGQKDLISLKPGKDGRTIVAVSRNGGDQLSLP